LKLIKKSDLKFARHGHSLVSIGDSFLVVTGSRIENNSADKSCEFYNIEHDVWFE